MQRVLVATDGSPSADAALAFAIDLCRACGATLHVISVTPPPAPRVGWTSRAPEVDAPLGPENIALAAAETAEQAGVASRAHVEHGDPAKVIARVSSEHRADLIVAGSRGHGPITGALLGSVSQGVLQRARVPVTIVRARESRHAQI